MTKNDVLRLSLVLSILLVSAIATVPVSAQPNAEVGVSGSCDDSDEDGVTEPTEGEGGGQVSTEDGDGVGGTETHIADSGDVLGLAAFAHDAYGRATGHGAPCDQNSDVEEKDRKGEDYIEAHIAVGETSVQYCWAEFHSKYNPGHVHRDSHHEDGDDNHPCGYDNDGQHDEDSENADDNHDSLIR